MRQSVARISEELGIHVVTLYNWRKAWRLQGGVVPASEKEPERWSAADKFTVVLETAGLNATDLSAYCRERGLYPQQVKRWRQAAQDANEKPVLTLKSQKELEKLRAQDQREIKALKIIDVWSRKVVAWDVDECEDPAIAADLVSRACLRERISKGQKQPLILHADNGNAMRAATLESRLGELGVLRSLSRPRVSNDNPYSESLFRTV